MIRKWFDLYPTITLDMWYFYIWLFYEFPVVIIVGMIVFVSIADVSMNKRKGIEKSGS